jgi:predicted acylesterase/phospholipase RssA/deferrochelatase/peroxidase EfeB
MSSGRRVEGLQAESGKRKCALILAGAAGKGPFAAGALSLLTKHLNELDVVCVVGTSSGALNGAVFAAGLRAGREQEAADLLEALWKEKANLLHILTPKSRQNIVKEALKKFKDYPEVRPVNLRIAMTSLDGIVELVRRRRHYTTYEKIATFQGADFETDRGIETISRHAIASAAIPFAFAPVKVNGTSYIDGGVVDNAPIGWVLRQDPEIEHLLVVTSDPRISPPPRWISPFPVAQFFNIVVRERLTRDLSEAYSFNRDLSMLRALGADMKRVRRDLHWRDLDITEIRPEGTTPGNSLSGFFSKSQRYRNWSDGRDAAARALEEPPARPAKQAHATAPAAGLPGAPMVQSQHLRKSSELLLIAPIKQGLVPVPGLTTTYPARLQLLLSVLSSLRQAGVERFAGVINLVGPLETIDSLRFVQWAILEGGRSLLLSATFDGPWESYIRNVVDDGGPFLDSIFCHCEGYSSSTEKHSTDHGYEAFAQWVRAHQVPTSFFYSATPGITARDTAWLAQLARLQAASPCPDFKKAATKLAVPPPTGDPSSITMFMQTLSAFFFLSASFPPPPVPEAEFLARAAIRQLNLLHPNPQRPDWLSGTSRDAWEWYEKVLRSPGRDPPPKPVQVIDAPETVQGNILTGYEGMTAGRIVFLQFTSQVGAADFVDSFRARTTTSRDGVQPARNIALTFRGLQNLGLDATALRDFPQEFQEGMERRAPMLGDVGINHPYWWEPPQAYRGGPSAPRVDLSTIDAVVIFQSAEDRAGDLDRLVVELETNGVRALGVQALRRTSGARNSPVPFGFVDGISQPIPRVDRIPGLKLPGLPGDQVALGELLLGYENDKRESPVYSNAAIFKNGSFLAMRKFKQEVEAFEAFVRDRAIEHAKVAPSCGRTLEDLLKGKMMGRYSDGTPLASDWLGGDKNDFNYGSPRPTTAASTGTPTPTRTTDIGQGCPLTSHIRRANPRVNGTPRIIRRGFACDDRNGDSGLVFMAYCASLGSQYEVVQKWVNGGNSTGTYGGQIDPMFAVHGIADATYSFLVGGEVVPIAIPKEPLVRVKWGLYLFAPSTRGLEEITRLAREAIGKQASPKRCPFAHAAQTPAGAAIAAGEAILDGLEALDPQSALDKWRAYMESDDPATAAEDRLVDAALRARPGFQPTPYGVLVSRIEDNLAVLANRTDYSVCEYGKRMSSSYGMHYLGRDPEDGHDAVARSPNAIISEITRETAYGAALDVGLALFAAAPAIVPQLGPGARVLVDLQQWSDLALCELVDLWFGFPDDNVMRKGGAAQASPLPCCPDDFRMVSNYIFGPQPTDVLSAFAQRRGRLVASAAAAFVAARSADPNRNTLMDRLLRERYMNGDEDAIASAWVGAVNGFTVPVGYNFALILADWLQSQELWRLQQKYRALPASSLDFIHGGPPPGFLFASVIWTMQRCPVPFLLHRRVKEPREVSPGVRATPETPVVLNLTSAGAEALENNDLDPAVFFGGAYKAEKGPEDPVHACPGQEMAWGVIMGLAAALFKQNNIMSEGLVSVSMDRPSSGSPPSPQYPL